MLQKVSITLALPLEPWLTFKFYSRKCLTENMTGAKTRVLISNDDN